MSIHPPTNSIASGLVVPLRLEALGASFKEACWGYTPLKRLCNGVVSRYSALGYDPGPYDKRNIMAPIPNERVYGT